LGQTNDNAIVFQDFNELDVESMPEQVTLYSQTTKSTNSFYNITEKLRAAGKTVVSNDTICRQVSNRDEDLRKFAAKYDKIVFVSGTKSSNGKVLYNVCKETNPNTYFISNKSEIDTKWFEQGDTIGICGATSTPMWLMEEVKEALEVF
ncbi:MAG: 4-hydroxy-3-methylbut-2-enyl diphosphate reductase, partial [Cytophagales bacterium]|nr:4-hydroxy-3-methylbut-2-enyl diphosphate reductase [Cytophagales bacterium]